MSMRVHTDRLAMVCWLPKDILQTTQLGDGTFGRFKATSKDAQTILRTREHVKALYLAARVVKVMMATKTHSVHRIHLTVVPMACVGDAKDIITQFLRDPDVVDYTNIWGFKLMIELADGLPAEASPMQYMQQALRRIMEANNLACGDLPGTEAMQDEPGEGGGRPQFSRKRRRDTGGNTQAWSAEVYRANEEVHLYDDQQALFRFGPGSNDWSYTMLNSDHMRYMLEVVTDNPLFYRNDGYRLHDDAGNSVFDAPLAFSVYGNNHWGTFVPPGAHPDYCRRLEPDIDGFIDLAAENDGEARLLHYTIKPTDFSNIGIFLTKRFPKFLPTHHGLHDHIMGCSSLYFLEQCKVNGASNNQSIWVRLKEAISAEKGMFPLPAAEHRKPDDAAGAQGAPLVVQRRVDGRWRCRLEMLDAEGRVTRPLLFRDKDGNFKEAEYIPERREWRATHRQGFSVISEYRVTEKSQSDMPGFVPMVELTATKGGRTSVYRLVQVGELPAPLPP